MFKSEMSSAPVKRPWYELFASSSPPGVGTRLGIDYARASSGPIRIRSPRHFTKKDIGSDDDGRACAEIVIQQDATCSGLFSVAWDCALVAAGLLLWRCPYLVRGKRILELGSGTGLVGICAGYAGASSVTLSDANVSDLLGANATAAAGACGPVLEVVEYCWGEDISKLFASNPRSGRRSPPDMVLCSDLLYEPGSMPALQRTLSELASALAAMRGNVDRGVACDDSGEKEEEEEEDEGAPGGLEPLAVLIVFKRRNDSVEQSFFEGLSETFDLEELMLEHSFNRKGEEIDVWCGLAERSRRGVHVVVGTARRPGARERIRDANESKTCSTAY